MRPLIGLACIVSLIAMPVGLFQLAQARRWAMFTGWMVFIIGWPLLMVAIWQMERNEFNLYLLTVVVCGWVPWIMAGFAMCGIADNRPKRMDH